MPPAIEKYYTQTIEFYRNMTMRSRIVAGLCLGLAIALLSYMILADTTNYSVLFSGLSNEDAARVREQLIKDRVPHKLEGGGGTIMVAKERLYEARLMLAAKKLPRGASTGLEILDNDKMGYSEFTNQVNYWRGLQGELERTFSWIDSVDAARVLIAMPHRSIFARKQQPSSASVTLRLHQGRTLSRSTVKGIVHLVSSSVAGLSPDRITVVDTEGSVLWKPRSGAGDPSNLQDFQASKEASLERKLADHLNATLGTGNWTGSVTVEVEPAAVEQMETEYNPDKTVVLSEGKQEKKELKAALQAQGIPGARGNLPGGPKPTSKQGQAGSSQKNQTVNYVPSVLKRKKLLPAGRLKRLSVVVSVNQNVLSKVAVAREEATAGLTKKGDKKDAKKDDKKKEAGKKGKGGKDAAAAKKKAAAAVAVANLEVLRKDLEEVVRNAVGYSKTRGDKVVVKAVPFIKREQVKAVVPHAAIRFIKSPTGNALLIGLGLLALAIVAFLLLRRRKDEAEVMNLPMTVRELESEVSGDGMGGEGYPELPAANSQAREMAHAAAEHDAFRSASVLRAWMARG